MVITSNLQFNDILNMFFFLIRHSRRCVAIGESKYSGQSILCFIQCFAHTTLTRCLEFLPFESPFSSDTHQGAKVWKCYFVYFNFHRKLEIKHIQMSTTYRNNMEIHCPRISSKTEEKNRLSNSV